jgi:hypothetical protein
MTPTFPYTDCGNRPIDDEPDAALGDLGFVINWLLGLVSDEKKKAVREAATDEAARAMLNEIDAADATAQYVRLIEAIGCATRTTAAPDEPVYRVVGVIGRVGMGEVWTSNDRPAGHHVAVKMAAGASSAGASWRARELNAPRGTPARPVMPLTSLLDFGMTVGLTPPETDREREVAAAWDHSAGAAADAWFKALVDALAGLADRLRSDTLTAIDRAVLWEYPDLLDLDDPAAGWRLCVGRFRWQRLLWFVRERCGDDVPPEQRWQVTGGLGRLSRTGGAEVYAKLASMVHTFAPAPDPRPQPRGGLGDIIDTILKEEWERRSSTVEDELMAEVGQLAGLDSVAWAAEVKDRHHFELIVVQESFPRVRDGGGIAEGDYGIVRHVADTGSFYASGDVQSDPLYFEDYKKTRSEQAALVTMGSRLPGGKEELLRYVVNQESERPATYHPVSAMQLWVDAQVKLKPLFREYLILKASEHGDQHCCVWSPRLDGWGLRDRLDSLLRRLVGSVQSRSGRRYLMNGLHLVVWYVDSQDQMLTVIGDTGYLNGVRKHECLKFRNAGLLGKLAEAQNWDTLDHDQQPELLVGGRPPTNDQTPSSHKSWLIVTPKVTLPSQGDPGYRLILQLVAVSEEASRLAKREVGELRQCAELVHHQVHEYATLYPQFAVDAVLKTNYSCLSISEQCQALAETIEGVLRAGAVSLYSRPLGSNRLHPIATTAPLRLESGRPGWVPDLEFRLTHSLLPSPHQARMGDPYVPNDSYVGALAERPGATLRRNSRQISLEQMLKQGFPTDPSDQYSEALPNADNTDRRFLGYSLPNNLSNHSTGLALVLRPITRPAFKAWDAAALAAMLNAAHDVFRSWREWEATRHDWAVGLSKRIRDNHELHKELADYPDQLQGHPGLVRYAQSGPEAQIAEELAAGDTVENRLLDPIPRVSSPVALAQRVAQDAYELVRASGGEKAWSVVQTTVLVEAREDARSVMHPVAYFHETGCEVPSKRNVDPRVLRAPGFDGDWRGFLEHTFWQLTEEGALHRDMAVAYEFRQPGRSERAGVYIPILAWVGEQAVRAVLTLDFDVTESRPNNPLQSDSNKLILDLLLLSRRLAAGWTVSGANTPHGLFQSRTEPSEFLKRLSKRLGEKVRVDLCLGPSDLQRLDRHVRDGTWFVPEIAVRRDDSINRGDTKVDDADAKIWHVLQKTDGGEVILCVPLRFGTFIAGFVEARWPEGEWNRPDQSDKFVLGERIRTILSAWYLWSWSWNDRSNSFNRMDKKFGVELNSNLDDLRWTLNHFGASLHASSTDGTDAPPKQRRPSHHEVEA